MTDHNHNHNPQRRRPPNLLLEFPVEEIPELDEFFSCDEEGLCPFHVWFWDRIFINPTGRRVLLVTDGLPTNSIRACCVALGLLLEILRDRLAAIPGRQDHAVVLNEMNSLLRGWFDAACEFPVEPEDEEPEDKAPPPGGRFFPPDDILAN
jgi:hypothetical protein